MPGSETQAWRRFLPQSGDENGGHSFASAHRDRRILVTGAGGYIGSALVKAIAASGPRCIILLDSSEYNLFEIQRHLELTLGHVPREAVLGTVDDSDLLDGIFSSFHPEIIYHAAAFKHVPLLELNPMAAVRNNAIGTWALAQTAIRHGASKFVLISTDKAVNPHIADKEPGQLRNPHRSSVFGSICIAAKSSSRRSRVCSRLSALLAPSF